MSIHSDNKHTDKKAPAANKKKHKLIDELAKEADEEEGKPTPVSEDEPPKPKRQKVHTVANAFSKDFVLSSTLTTDGKFRIGWTLPNGRPSTAYGLDVYVETLGGKSRHSIEMPTPQYFDIDAVYWCRIHATASYRDGQRTKFIFAAPIVIRKDGEEDPAQQRTTDQIRKTSLAALEKLEKLDSKLLAPDAFSAIEDTLVLNAIDEIVLKKPLSENDTDVLQSSVDIAIARGKLNALMRYASRWPLQYGEDILKSEIHTLNTIAESVTDE